MKHTLTLLTALLLVLLAALHASDHPATVPQLVTQVWADYDPNRGDFKEEIVREETKDGYQYRESYISNINYDTTVVVSTDFNGHSLETWQRQGDRQNTRQRNRPELTKAIR